MTTAQQPRTPGPQNPSKYPFTGPNYAKYGEQPGYVYVPHLDGYFIDTKGLQNYYEQSGLKDPAPKDPSLLQTLAPVAATAGAIYGAQSLAPQLIGSTKEGTGLLGLGGDIFSGSAPTVATQGANAASTGAASGSLGQGGMSLVSGGEGIGEGVAGGSTSTASAGLMGALAPAAVAGIGAYTAKKGYDAYNAGKGKGLLGGLKAGIKSAGALNFVPVLGQAAWLGGALGGLIGHKSTKEIQSEHTDDLMGKSNDAGWQGYVQGARAQNINGRPEGEKAYAGKYDTWDEYKKGGLEASNLTHVYGNLDTYGEKWASLSEAQRQAITQKNIADGLYDSKKGEVVITDKDQALANFDSIVNPQQPQTMQVNGMPATTIAPVPVQRGGGLVKMGS